MINYRIKGLSWGKKNGPPYLLNRDNYIKEQINRNGWLLQ